jgi:FkbM family methyltransferase
MAYDLIHVFKRLGIIPTNLILVGAWEGGEVAGYLKEGVQKAYLFEAEPSAMKILHQTYGEDSRVRLFEGAVSSEEGKQKKFHVLNHGSSSLFAPNLGMLKKILPDFLIEDEIQVLTVTLDSSLRNHWESWGESKLGTLVILDIQGGELEALKGAKNLLERVDWIQSEVSTANLYQGQNSLSQLDEFLKGEGFDRVSTRIYKGRNHGDALYFRPNLITKTFRLAMKVEDLHWNLARIRPTWIPSLRGTKFGRFILKLILGRKSTY